MVPWEEWPMQPDVSPVRVMLEYQGRRYVLQPGRDDSGLWQFAFRSAWPPISQPFDVVAGAQCRLERLAMAEDGGMDAADRWCAGGSACPAAPAD